MCAPFYIQKGNAKMIVYHGSNHRFKKLRIAKRLVESPSTLVNEGLGIYFSTEKSIASSYGKYLYTLEINEKYLVNYRDIYTCHDHINFLVERVAIKCDVDIRKYFSTFEMVDRMRNGAQMICNIGHDIAEILDNTEEFYLTHSKYKRESIYRLLRSYDNFKKTLVKAYMFRYFIPNIGVIKDVSDDVVKIVSIERI